MSIKQMSTWTVGETTWEIHDKTAREQNEKILIELEEIKESQGGDSPTIVLEQTEDGANITITDKNGSTTAKVNHGKAASVKIGTVTTLPAGSEATVVNSGTSTEAILDFGIPRGADGTNDDNNGSSGGGDTVNNEALEEMKSGAIGNVEWNGESQTMTFYNLNGETKKELVIEKENESVVLF